MGKVLKATRLQVAFVCMLFWIPSIILTTDLPKTDLPKDVYRKVRVEYPGPFVVCSAAHFMHEECYDRWPKGCPSCNAEHKDSTTEISVLSAFFEKHSEDCCAICLEGYDGKPSLGTVPSAPPVSPVSDGSAARSPIYFGMPPLLVAPEFAPTAPPMDLNLDQERIVTDVKAFHALDRAYFAQIRDTKDPLQKKLLIDARRRQLAMQFTRKK